MWSIETEAPDPSYCDVHWAYDAATFTCQDCPFLFVTGPCSDKNGHFIVRAPSVLHASLPILRSLVGETDDEETAWEEEAPIEIDTHGVLSEDDPHRPAAEWILTVRPYWIRGKGVQWTVAHALWVPTS